MAVRDQDSLAPVEETAKQVAARHRNLDQLRRGWSWAGEGGRPRDRQAGLVSSYQGARNGLQVEVSTTSRTDQARVVGWSQSRRSGGNRKGWSRSPTTRPPHLNGATPSWCLGTWLSSVSVKGCHCEYIELACPNDTACGLSTGHPR